MARDLEGWNRRLYESLISSGEEEEVLPPPVPIEPQPSKPLKVEPNPFLTDTSHLPEIHEVNEEEIDEELEGLTLK